MTNYGSYNEWKNIGFNTYKPSRYANEIIIATKRADANGTTLNLRPLSITANEILFYHLVPLSGKRLEHINVCVVMRMACFHENI